MTGAEAARTTRLLQAGHWPGKEAMGIWADGHLSCRVKVWCEHSGTYEWWLSAPAEARDTRERGERHARLADLHAAGVSSAAGRPGMSD